VSALMDVLIQAVNRSKKSREAKNGF
jgi:hypothetical protein